MEKLSHEQSLKETNLKSFILPYALLIIAIFLISTVVLLDSITMKAKLCTQEVLSEKLFCLNESGISIIQKLLIEKGYTDTITLIQNNPKLYIDENGDGTNDSVLVFTFINKSSTEIEFVCVAYILKIEERGNTDHVLTKHKLSPTSPREFKIMQSIYVLDSNYCTDIKFNAADNTLKEIKRIEISTTQ